MVKRSLLLLTKTLEFRPFSRSSGNVNPKVIQFLESRKKVHQNAIKHCEDVLRKKDVTWKAISRSDLTQPIRNFDLVVTIGGDGTLLQASHFIRDSTPLLGVNSDPTQTQQVSFLPETSSIDCETLSQLEEFENEFDASRSTGYLCATDVSNFEQTIDRILAAKEAPDKLTRISVKVNAEALPSYALNDILIADPSPAKLSKFSFKIGYGDGTYSQLVHCRCSGMRIATAAGSTAAMRSGGGYVMPILGEDLQYMVREPISGNKNGSPWMHDKIEPGRTMEITWFGENGSVFFDGGNDHFNVCDGDVIEVSSNAPYLHVFLPNREGFVHKSLL